MTPPARPTALLGGITHVPWPPLPEPIYRAPECPLCDTDLQPLDDGVLECPECGGTWTVRAGARDDYGHGVATDDLTRRPCLAATEPYAVRDDPVFANIRHHRYECVRPADDGHTIHVGVRVDNPWWAGSDQPHTWLAGGPYGVDPGPRVQGPAWSPYTWPAPTRRPMPRHEGLTTGEPFTERPSTPGSPVRRPIETRHATGDTL